MTPLPLQPVIQAQLDAYNRHDAEAFAAAYAPEAELLELASGTLLAKGTEAIRAHYAARFQANPALRAEVLHRLLQGPFVIDQERLTGVRATADGPEQPPFTAVVIYQVAGDRITRAWLVR